MVLWYNDIANTMLAVIFSQTPRGAEELCEGLIISLTACLRVIKDLKT